MGVRGSLVGGVRPPGPPVGMDPAWIGGCASNMCANRLDEVARDMLADVGGRAKLCQQVAPILLAGMTRCGIQTWHDCCKRAGEWERGVA